MGGDLAIANEVNQLAAAVLMGSPEKTKLDAESSFCVWPKDLGHVYLSPLDRFTLDHWWLLPNRTDQGVTVLDLLVNYLDGGVFVPQSRAVSDDYFLHRPFMCDLTR